MQCGVACVLMFVQTHALAHTGCKAVKLSGLGSFRRKTLQTLALLWSALRQGSSGGKPLIRRAVVVAPTTITQNWAAEYVTMPHRRS